jgi:8-oxo-dGTP pyrophosphatase MutT (NUDIX family)
VSRYARRSARVILIDSADCVLLIRSALVPTDHDQGFGWFTPGGGVEEGEELPTAAARELFEEVGLRAAAHDLQPIAYGEGYVDLLPWAAGLFRDDYFLHRVDRHEVDTRGQTSFERSHYGGHRWWNVAELGATTETIFPYGLRELLEQVVSGALPAAPVQLPWHV